MDLIALTLVSHGHYSVGDALSVRIRCSASPAVRALSVDAIISWDESVLRLDGIDRTANTMPFVYLDMPSPKSLLHDFSGINEAIPPADGDALIYWLSELGTVVMADDDIVCDLVFTAISPFDSTSVGFIPSLTYTGYPQETVVYGSGVAGQDVTGALTAATVLGNEFDFNGDHVVDAIDLATVFGEWDTRGASALAGVLSSWGSCAE